MPPPISDRVQTDEHGGAIEPLDVLILRIETSIGQMEKAKKTGKDARLRMQIALAECLKRFSRNAADFEGCNSFEQWLGKAFPYRNTKYLMSEAAKAGDIKKTESDNKRAAEAMAATRAARDAEKPEVINCRNP